MVAVDPIIGKMKFLSPLNKNDTVLASYAYGYVGDIGGGPYRRYDNIESYLNEINIYIDDDLCILFVKSDDTGYHKSIDEAYQWWKNEGNSKNNCVIIILDNYSYSLSPITIEDGNRLVLIAGSGEPSTDGDSLKLIKPSYSRPHIDNGMNIQFDEKLGNSLHIDGILIEGGINISSDKQSNGKLDITHCTLTSRDADTNIFSCSNVDIQLTARKCIFNGSLRFKDSRSQIKIDKSIVTGDIFGIFQERQRKSVNISVEEPAITNDPGNIITFYNTRLYLDIVKSTIFGKVNPDTLSAENSIFNSVVSPRTQVGCLRYCYTPQKSIATTPSRFKCQPDLENSKSGTEGKIELSLNSLQWNMEILHLLNYINPALNKY
ncbi:MAG: hypothetical protein IPG76_18450 [Acidobacteria bacterium]|nr:hypothetical protein [Acidobacteriota bacterium]